jgi:hypothetical protein
MICTFYSFKGGVGRSMALANVADILARKGASVLMIDFDLEAPGLEQFFPVSQPTIRENLGLLDLLLTYKRSMSRGERPQNERPEFTHLESFIVPIYESLSVGRLDLMPAGRREGIKQLSEYAVDLRKFDWQDFFFNWAGENFFEWMRNALDTGSARKGCVQWAGRGGYDVVLVDSRTGVTELGGICAYHLADIIVMLCAPNQQNVEGTRDMVRDFSSPEVMELRRERPVQFVIVPARVEQRSPGALDEFRGNFESVFGTYQPVELRRTNLSFWDLMIPYDPAYAFDEAVLFFQPKRGEGAIAKSFSKLAEAVACIGGLSFPSAGIDGQANAAGYGEKLPMIPELPLQYDITQRFAPYDVYVSFSSRSDRTSVDTLVKLLRRNDLRLFYNDFAPGDQIAARIDQALHRSRNVLVCIGPDGVTGDWQQHELRLAFDAATTGKKLRVIPVLLPGADSIAIPTSLSRFFWADFRDGFDDPVQLDQLMRSIRSLPTEEAGVAIGQEPPFIGLRPFSARDRRFFFGRGELLERAADTLRRSPTVLITGPSGSGKTSFVQASLLPKLKEDLSLGLYEAHFLTTRPGGSSLREITGDLGISISNVVLFIDQLEEMFTMLGVEERNALISSLQSSIESGKVKVITALRADFIGELLTCPGAEVISGNLVPLHPLRPYELREVIEGPARAAGIMFEPGLVERIIRDIGADPGNLPLLQLVLEQLWNQRYQGWLTNEAYDRFGTARALASSRLDLFFESLSSNERLLLKHVIMQLIYYDGTGRLTRRRAKPEALVPNGKALGDVLPLVERMVSEHLLVAGGEVGNASGRGRFIELAHDVESQLLRQWLAEESSNLQLKQRVMIAADEWMNLRSPELLLDGQVLDDAKALLGSRPSDFSVPEVAFVRASVTARTRHRVLRHVTELITAGGGALIFVLLRFLF